MRVERWAVRVDYDSPMRRLFLNTLAAIVVLAAVVVIGGYLYLRLSLPQFNGTATVAGISAPISGGNETFYFAPGKNPVKHPVTAEVMEPKPPDGPPAYPPPCGGWPGGYCWGGGAGGYPGWSEGRSSGRPGS